MGCKGALASCTVKQLAHSFLLLAALATALIVPLQAADDRDNYHVRHCHSRRLWHFASGRRKFLCHIRAIDSDLQPRHGPSVCLYLPGNFQRTIRHFSYVPAHRNNRSEPQPGRDQADLTLRGRGRESLWHVSILWTRRFGHDF
jgi:hypothetical protein